MVESESVADLKWVPEGEGAARGANKHVVKALRRLIRDKNKKTIRKILERWSPEDIMELLVKLPFKAARKLIDILPDQISSRVLSELRPQYRAAITRDETVERPRDLILRMPPEKAFDTCRICPTTFRTGWRPISSLSNAFGNRWPSKRRAPARSCSGAMLR